MTQQRILENKITWKQDAASVQAAVQGNQQVAASFNPVVAQIQAMNLSSKELALVAKQLGLSEAELAGASTNVTQKLGQQTTQVGTLAQRYQDVKNAAEAARAAQASAAPNGASVSSGGLNGQQIAGRVAGLGALLGSQAGGQVFPAVAQVIQLGVAFGAAGAAVGVFGLALRILTTEAEKEAKRLVDSAAAVSAARERALTASREQLEQERADAITLVARRQQDADEANAALLARGRATGFAGAQPLLGNILDPTFAGLKDTADAANTALATAQVNLNGLNVVLAETGETAGGAAQNLEAARKQFVQGQIDTANTLIKIDSLTTEQRNERIAAIARETSILSKAIEAEGATTEAQNVFADRIAELGAEFTLLTGITSTYADQLEREQRAKQADIDVSDATEAGLRDLEKAQQDVQKATEGVTTATEKLEDAQRAHGDKLLAIDADLAEKEQKLATDLGDKQRKLETKLGDDLLKLQEASDLRIAQSKERDNLSIEAAVARGDIAAAQQVLAEQKLRIKQEKETLDTSKKQAREAAADQLRDDREANAAQLSEARTQAQRLRDEEQTRYREQLADLRDNLNKAVDAQRFANAALEVQRQLNAFSQTYWNARVQMAYDALAGRTEDFVNRMLAAGNRLFQATGSNMGGGIGAAVGAVLGGSTGSAQVAQDRQAAILEAYARYYGIQGFDSGGISTRPGLFYSGVPEAHIPLSQMGSGGLRDKTFVFAIDARGSDISEARFRQMVREEVVPRVESAKTEVVTSLADANRRYIRRHG